MSHSFTPTKHIARMLLISAIQKLGGEEQNLDPENVSYLLQRSSSQDTQFDLHVL